MNENDVPQFLLVSKPRLRWRFWLTLGSPLVLLCAFVGYYGLIVRNYAPAAEAATNVFHQRFVAGQDEAIYFNSGPEWGSTIDLETERKLFARIRRKLGPCSYYGPLSRFVSVTSNGSFVTLRYNADCKNGPMDETFAWRVSSQQTQLINYQATSKLLLID